MWRDDIFVGKLEARHRGLVGFVVEQAARYCFGRQRTSLDGLLGGVVALALETRVKFVPILKRSVVGAETRLGVARRFLS